MVNCMSHRVTPDMVLQGYCVGVFPMGHPNDVITWHEPDPRCIFDFDKFKLSRSLRKTVERGVFEVTVNTAFERVIRECGERPEGTWITRRILELYCELHRQGFAHSIECWKAGTLVGGLYGIAIGAAFFGESMFHRATDASKVALVHLIRRLRERGYTLLDTQWSTPHLESLGAIQIPRSEYLARLDAAIRQPHSFTNDSPEVGLVESGE